MKPYEKAISSRMKQLAGVKEMTNWRALRKRQKRTRLKTKATATINKIVN